MFSIILPIYNVEKYINALLESVQRQTYTDFEVLMIDDGSVDNTASICKGFAENDGRFHYYFKENGGAGSARNYGMTLANGEYIVFLDSDDIIKVDYLERLMSGFQNERVCIAMSGIEIIKNDSVLQTMSLPDQAWNGHAFQQYVLSRKIPIFLLQSSCAKMYKKSWVLEQDICFDETISVSEDSLFNTQLMSRLTDDDIIATLPYVGYQYRWDNTDSIQRSKKTFQKVKQGLVASIRTLKIRRELAQCFFKDDDKVQTGLRQAHAVVAICAAHDIETNNFTDDQRKELYSMYLDDIQYDLMGEYSNHPNSDKKILKCTMRKDPKGIHGVYQMRALKERLLSIIKR